MQRKLGHLKSHAAAHAATLFTDLGVWNVNLGFLGTEMELTYHDGTVRDAVFMQDTSNRFGASFANSG